MYSVLNEPEGLAGQAVDRNNCTLQVLAPQRVRFYELGEVSLKGFAKSVEVFEARLS
jgi:hypothetical protein